MKAIGNQAVHCGHASCAHVAEPGELQRGWPAREYEQPTADVSTQIDKDVDFVAPNLAGKLVVREIHGDMPRIGRGAKAGCEIIVFRKSIGVTDDRARRFVEALEEL